MLRLDSKDMKRRCELHPLGEPEHIDPVSQTVVGKCYSISELMSRTLAGMPTPVSSFPVSVSEGDTSDLFDDDEDDALVHLSNMRELLSEVEFEESNKESTEKKPVNEPVDK